jgi:DNA-binding NarL/FixJ family response regulator
MAIRAAAAARCHPLEKVPLSNTNFTRWHKFSPASILNVRAAFALLVLNTQPRRLPIRPPLRILIADDHPVVRFGLKAILSSQEGWQVVGDAKSGAEALALAIQLEPDIVILDINMPGMSGLDALKAIRTRLPLTRAVVLTLHYSVELLQEIRRAGGKGYVTKSDADRDLVAAVKAVAAGGTYFTLRPVDTPPAIPAMSATQPADLGSLSAREREAVRNIAQTMRKLL